MASRAFAGTDAIRFRVLRDAVDEDGEGAHLLGVGVQLPSGSVVIERVSDGVREASGLELYPGDDGLEEFREERTKGTDAYVEFVEDDTEFVDD